MPKVRILTNVSDVAGAHVAGDELDLTDEQAKAYVEGGLAELLGSITPELAMLADAPEHATLPRGKPRG